MGSGRETAETPGVTIHADGFVDRRGRVATWVALAPRSLREHARDLVGHIAHETALLGDEPSRREEILFGAVRVTCDQFDLWRDRPHTR